VPRQARSSCLDYLVDEIDVADENDGLYATRDGGVEHCPIQQLRPDDRDDDPFECRPLRLVDADRPAVGELLKVGRFRMDFRDGTQGAVHEPRADRIARNLVDNGFPFGVELRGLRVIVLQPDDLRADAQTPVLDVRRPGHKQH